MAVARATKLAAVKTPATPVSKYTLETGIAVTRERSSKPLDQDLIDALLASKAAGGAWYSLEITDAPAIKNQKTEVLEQNEKTAEQFVRRHAQAAGVGCSVAAHPSDKSRVLFRGQDKRVVPTGAARAPRGSKKAVTA